MAPNALRRVYAGPRRQQQVNQDGWGGLTSKYMLFCIFVAVFANSHPVRRVESRHGGRRSRVAGFEQTCRVEAGTLSRVVLEASNDLTAPSRLVAVQTGVVLRQGLSRQTDGCEIEGMQQR